MNPTVLETFQKYRSGCGGVNVGFRQDFHMDLGDSKLSRFSAQQNASSLLL
jgi:hypothetical protein